MRTIIHEPFLPGGAHLHSARLIVSLTFAVLAALTVILWIVAITQTDRVNNAPPPSARQEFVHPAIDGPPLTRI